MKVLAVAAAALVGALIFGIAPCYVAPLVVSGTARVFCGFKSAPPHFELQLAIWAGTGAVLAWWLLFRRR